MKIEIFFSVSSSSEVISFTFVKVDLALSVRFARALYEPCLEKTCFCHMQITKAQISLRIRAV